MVLLFDILQAHQWNHLSSGLTALDEMLNLQSDAILDLQSVPINPALYVMLSHLMCSHLLKSDQTKVVVLETINSFPWDILRRHSQFRPSWISDKRIIKYDLSSFSKIYAFFKLMPLQEPHGLVLLAITNFHELLELYRYQFIATHEEYMLKHQIEQYRVLLKYQDKAREEGIESVKLPSLPPESSLRENPYFRCQSHIHELFSSMSQWTVKHGAVILLLGHMEPKYIAPQGEPSKSSQMDSSQPSMPSSSQYEKRRFTLAPVIFGDKNNPCENKISCKLLFYYDWYFRSPHFKSESRPISSQDHYLVSVVKVISGTSLKNIPEPIYFDFKNSYSSKDPQIAPDCFIYLSDPHSNEHREGLSSLLQETISYTQVYSRKVGENNKDLQMERSVKYSMPSSPPQSSSTFHATEMPIQTFPSPTTSESEDLAPTNTEEDFPSVIDASDVESIGTLLDDVEENYSSSDDFDIQSKKANRGASWLARHT